MGVKLNLVDRTVTNTGDEDLVLRELIERVTKIPAGGTVPLDPDTRAVQF